MMVFENNGKWELCTPQKQLIVRKGVGNHKGIRLERQPKSRNSAGKQELVY